MTSELDPQIAMLLSKYAGRRMPPLVDMDDPESGLINKELLRVYHSGIMRTYSLSLRILLAAGDHLPSDHRWRKGDFRLNEWARPWSAFCEELRKTPVGNQACEECDRRRATIAEREGDVIAYLCDSGMVDFAVPISVKNQVVAVLFCGQLKPQGGAIWNPEFAQRNGFFRPLTPNETGVDARAKSQWRIQDIEQRAGLPEGTLLGKLNNTDLVKEIGPQQVEVIRQVLRDASAQLSSLATSTYELEKGKVVDWIRNSITGSLAPLGTAAAETAEIWKRLSSGLDYMIRYWKLDYALILSCCGETGREIKVLCQSGLPEASFPMGKTLSTPLSLATLRSAICNSKQPAPIVLRDYKDLPLLDHLHRLHSRGKSKQALMIPILASLESAPAIMLLGGFKQDVELNTFPPDDREALQRVSEAVALVAETILLVERLDETARKQTRFLEDVAHDIRTPIHNIIIEAEVLARGLVPAEETRNLTQKLLAQVRRLHLMSQRLWMLMNIDRRIFKLDEVEPVNVYQTLIECRKLLLELAAKRNVDVIVNREMERWSAIQVNRALFVQSVLNLIDNAIKYSREGTEVRLDGNRLPKGVTLSFTDRGIPVREEDKKKILQPYYRSTEARLYRQEGTGIGLSIVKAFADLYGSIDVKSVPVHGTRDYITEFKLFVRKGE